MAKRYDTTGVATLVEFGQGASNIKSSGAELQTRNNADSAYANHAGADATLDDHFVTKRQLDNQAAGLSWKEPVRVATTGPGTLATDFENGDTVDGVVLATGNRILLKNQASGVENGIYIVQASGAPVRASDMAAGADAASNAMFVQEGTVNADIAYVCTNDTGSGVVGTDALVFVQFASITGGVTSVNDAVAVPGGGSSFLASGGSGAVTLNVLDDSARISVSLASSIITLDVVNGSIDTAQLADDGVTEAKLAALVGTIYRRVTVGFGDAGSSVNIGAALPANAVVQEVKVNTTIAFDITTTLEVGIAADPDLLQTTALNNLNIADLYITDHDEGGAASGQLLATLSAGAPTAGSATITVAFIVTA